MTLVRIELPARESELEIQAGDRTYRLKGGDHITVNLDRKGDTVALVLTLPAPDASRHMGLPPLDPAMDMDPRIPSARRGIYEVINGVEIFKGHTAADAAKKDKWSI